MIVMALHNNMLGASAECMRSDIRKFGSERFSGSSSTDIESSILLLDPTALDLPRICIGDGFLHAKATAFRRFPSLLRDLEYVLETPSTASFTLGAATTEVPSSPPSFASLWARHLRLSQGIDKISRQKDVHVLFEDESWVSALSHDLALSHAALALSGSRSLDSLTNLYESLMQEMKRWIYRDGLPPPSIDMERSHLASFQLIKQLTTKEEWPLRSYFKFPFAVSLSSTRINSTESQIKIETKSGPNQIHKSTEILASIDAHIASSPQDSKSPPPLLQFLQTKFSALTGDCVLFHLPLHRNLAQAIISYCKLPESETPEAISYFLKPVPTKVIPPSVCQSGEEVQLPGADVGTDARVALSCHVAAAKTVRALVEFPLRAIVAWRQIGESRMWLRNGQGAMQLAVNYAMPPLCRSLRDLDLTILQFSAAGGSAGLGAKLTWDLMTTRFSLDGYLTDLVPKDSRCGGWVDPPKLEEPEHSLLMLESFFHTLNVLVTELPPPPPKNPAEESAIITSIVRRELIHKLVASDNPTHSECFRSAVSGVTVNEGTAPANFNEIFEAVIKEIAVESRNATGTAKVFELKPSAAYEYDPCFFHLSKIGHQSAMEKIAHLRSKHMKNDPHRCAPLVQPLKTSHEIFKGAVDILFAPQSISAVRRSLLVAMLGGQWVPPLKPDEAPNASNSGSGAPSSSVDEESVRRTGRNRTLSSASSSSIAAASDAATTPVCTFSKETIASSSVSILEVLQFCTLQFFALSARSDGSKKSYVASVFANMASLPPNSWFLTQLPPTFLPESTRTSFFGMLFLIYAFSAESGGDPMSDIEDKSSHNSNKSPNENSGAKELIVSGLTFLLRGLELLSATDCSMSIPDVAKAASSGSRPDCVASFAPYLARLWPSKDPPRNTSSPDAEQSENLKKAACKEARARAMAKMKAMQSNFAVANANALDDETENEDNLCIICRCANDEPMGFIAHAQRSRIFQHPVSKTRNKMSTFCTVVNQSGCQLRASPDLKAEKVGLVPFGETVKVAKTQSQNSSDTGNPLQSRRVYVEHEESRIAGWASMTSSQGDTEILRRLSDDGTKGRWGCTRPLIKCCGHFAHTACVEKHVLSLHQKAINNVQYMGIYSADVKVGEFLCPLCHSVSNLLVPKKKTKTKCAEEEKEEEQGDKPHPAADAFARDLLLAMQPSHITRKNIPRREMHDLANHWDCGSLSKYRSFLVGFSAVGFAAAQGVHHYDFDLSNMSIIVDAVKMLLSNSEGARSKVKESILDGFHCRVPTVFANAKKDPTCFDAEICSYLSTMPCHVARDGQLPRKAAARACMSSAYWMHYSERYSNVFRANSEGEGHYLTNYRHDADPPYLVIPKPLSAFSSTSAPLGNELPKDAELIGAVYPLLPVLSWDLATLSSAVFCLGVEKAEIEVVVRLLIIARVLQIIICDMGVCKAGDFHPSVLREDSDLLREVCDKLCPYLKVFLMVAASCNLSEGKSRHEWFGDAFLEDLLHEEDCRTILSLIKVDLEELIAEEMADGVGVAKLWLADVVELEKWQGVNAERSMQEVVKAANAQFVDDIAIAEGVSEFWNPYRNGAALHPKVAKISSYFADVGMREVIPGQLSLLGEAKLHLVRGEDVPISSSRKILSREPFARDFSHEMSVCPSMNFDPFISLPQNFVDLYDYVTNNEAASEEANSFDDESGKVEWAIDLLTGRVCKAGKPQGKPKRNTGSCTSHAQDSGSGIGIFFLLTKATVLLLSGMKSVYWKSIYVDSHGEEDIGLKRGRPLFLNQARLQALKDLYLNHDIVKVVASIRSTSDRVIREGWY